MSEFAFYGSDKLTGMRVNMPSGVISIEYGLHGTRSSVRDIFVHHKYAPSHLREGWGEGEISNSCWRYHLQRGEGQKTLNRVP